MASLQDDRGLNGDFHDRGSCILCLEMEELHKTREENQICRCSMSEPEKVDSLKPNNSNKRNHEIDLKRIFNFPNKGGSSTPSPPQRHTNGVYGASSPQQVTNAEPRAPFCIGILSFKQMGFLSIKN